MYGPGILARFLHEPGPADKHGNHWPYHSRSDRDSKVGPASSRASRRRPQYVEVSFFVLPPSRPAGRCPHGARPADRAREGPATAATLPGAGADTTARTLTPQRRLRQAALEFTLLAVLFQLYRLARLVTAEDFNRAFENAVGVLRVERLLRLPDELILQGWTLHSDTLVRAANTYYATVHFPVTVGFLVWLFLRRPADYGWFRSSIIGLTAASLVVHLLVPLAPPRMMPGFVDTGVLFGQSVYDGSLGEAANQIAAMPSLHVGWAVLVAVAALATLRTRWRWLVVAHPTITLLVVVVTGNHYWLDALVAVALLAVALGVFAPRPLRRLPWLAQDRAARGGSAGDPDRENHPQPCPKQHGSLKPSLTPPASAREASP